MGTLIDLRSALALGPSLALIGVLAVLGKLAGGYVGGRIAGFGWPIGIGMVLVPRGEFTLVLAKAGVDATVVPSVIYPIAGFSVLVTAIVGPLLGRVKVLNRPADQKLPA